MSSNEIDWIKLSNIIHLISNKAYRIAKNHNLIMNLKQIDSFQSHEDYVEKIFPLFQNENFKSLVKELEYHQKIFVKQGTYPLKLKVAIDQHYDASPRTGIRLLVLDQINQNDNQASWKYQNYAQYLRFNEATEFIGAIYIKSQGSNNIIYSTLSVYSRYEKEDYIIIPYSENTINNFLYKQVNREGDTLLLSRKQLILNFIPLSTPQVYKKEVQQIFNLRFSSFYELIIKPSRYQNQIDSNDFTQKIQELQNQHFNNKIFRRNFDDSQLSAIENAINFNKRVTLIEGPPGTGKTQTIFGIISILSNFIRESRNKSEKDVILILGKSNSVVNDLVRKINKSLENQDTITNCSDESRDYLKVVRFGRPELCENDIARYSLEIRSQEMFFSKYKDRINQILKTYITKQIEDLLDKEQIQDFQSYLKEINQQITLVSLEKYINNLNFNTKNQKILNAFGQVYTKLSDKLKVEEIVYKKIEEENFKYRHIVVSTLNSCSKRRFKILLQNQRLRMCIVDEAPTALEPSQLIPLVEYNDIDKLVLLGDTKQLSPIVIANESEKQNLNRSLFERFLNKLTPQKLTYQYRQMPNLAYITSQIFYNGTLKNGQHNLQFPYYIRNIMDNDRNSLFFSTPCDTEEAQETSYKNSLECKAIILLVKYLLSDEIISEGKKLISIICAYSMQKELMRMQLQQNNLYQYAEVDTVDSFQGKENEIVILSLVRSNHSVGFLSDVRRSNVALSRAKYCQFVFGNTNTLNQNRGAWQKIVNLYQENRQIIYYDSEKLQNPQFFRQQLKVIK